MSVLVNLLNSYFFFVKFQILYSYNEQYMAKYNISIIFQNYDPVYPYCILANSDDRVHTLSNAILPYWVPKISNGWKGWKAVTWYGRIVTLEYAGLGRLV